LGEWCKTKKPRVQNAKNIGVLVRILKFQEVHLHPLNCEEHRPFVEKTVKLSYRKKRNHW
jgi:hypothetical protein